MASFIRFAAILILGVTAAKGTAAAPLELEQTVFLIDEIDGARAVGFLRNNTTYRVVLPTLEVTYVTKEQPTKLLKQRLILNTYAEPGQSRPFHSATCHDHFGNVLEIRSPR